MPFPTANRRKNILHDSNSFFKLSEFRLNGINTHIRFHRLPENTCSYSSFLRFAYIKLLPQKYNGKKVNSRMIAEAASIMPTSHTISIIAISVVNAHNAERMQTGLFSVYISVFSLGQLMIY